MTLFSWGIDVATVKRPTAIAFVTAPGLSEQQRIADALLAEELPLVKVNVGDAKIWTPKRD